MTFPLKFITSYMGQASALCSSRKHPDTANRLKGTSIPTRQSSEGLWGMARASFLGGSPKVSIWQAGGYLGRQEQQLSPREPKKLLQAAARTRVGNTESSWLSIISVFWVFVCLIFISPLKCNFQGKLCPCQKEKGERFN